MSLLSRLFGGDEPKWRKMYDPLIKRYTAIAGAHFQAAELEGRESSPLEPLGVLLKEAQPTLSEDEIEHFLQVCKRQFDSFDIAGLLTEIMQEANIPEEEILTRLRENRDIMLSERNYNGYFVRFVIGEVIGYNFEGGLEERKLFWTAMLSGDVV